MQRCLRFSLSLHFFFSSATNRKWECWLNSRKDGLYIHTYIYFLCLFFIRSFHLFAPLTLIYNFKIESKEYLSFKQFSGILIIRAILCRCRKMVLIQLQWNLVIDRQVKGEMIFRQTLEIKIHYLHIIWFMLVKYKLRLHIWP